jgi:hypothetical protein
MHAAKIVIRLGRFEISFGRDRSEMDSNSPVRALDDLVSTSKEIRQYGRLADVGILGGREQR